MFFSKLLSLAGVAMGRAPCVAAARWAAAASVLFLALPPPSAAADARNVLVLYANGRLLPAAIEADREFRKTLVTSSESPIDVFDEFLDAPRFDKLSGVSFVNYLRDKYAGRRPAVIVAAGGEALAFLLRHRDEIFSGVPVVHMGVFTQELAPLLPLPADVVGVPFRYDYAQTLALALRLHPKASRLVIVTGAAKPDLANEAQLRQATSSLDARTRIDFFSGLPQPEVVARLSRLPRDAVVFTVGFFKDGDGRDFIPRETTDAMLAVSTAPIYSTASPSMGSGVVGGHMTSFGDMGRQGARIVVSLLTGAAPQSLHLAEVMPATLRIDARQLRRWDIDERLLPGDAVELFKSPSFWDQYRYQAVAVAAVFLLQAALISGLLVERFRRRVAEQAMQRQRFELVHASRLAVAGELTGSIAHEINQPLAAILSNADAADLMLESTSDRRQDVRGLLAAIRRDDMRASEVIRRLRSLLAKQEIERRPFSLDAAVADVCAILVGEARRRDIQLVVMSAAGPAIVIGDRIQMQQVLINLIVNAMDELGESAPERRIVTIGIEQLGAELEVSVRDLGPGILPEHMPKLFDSFFTTKRQGMGLGLSIASTIVRSHGGRLRAENEAGGGAGFYVTLPAASSDTRSVATP